MSYYDIGTYQCFAVDPQGQLVSSSNAGNFTVEGMTTKQVQGEVEPEEDYQSVVEMYNKFNFSLVDSPNKYV